MSTQPYAPSAYRPDRVILFATDANEVMRVDESILTQDGSTITAYIQSPSLNRDQRGVHHEYTLRRVTVYYTADSASTITLTASGDGGVNWTAVDTATATTTVAQTTTQIQNVTAPFNVTGYDLRLRIQFTTDVPVKVFGYTPRLVRRGRVYV